MVVPIFAEAKQSACHTAKHGYICHLVIKDNKSWTVERVNRLMNYRE
jgi:hypothetical protein